MVGRVAREALEHGTAQAPDVHSGTQFGEFFDFFGDAVVVFIAKRVEIVVVASAQRLQLSIALEAEVRVFDEFFSDLVVFFEASVLRIFREQAFVDNRLLVGADAALTVVPARGFLGEQFQLVPTGLLENAQTVSEPGLDRDGPDLIRPGFSGRGFFSQ